MGVQVLQWFERVEPHQRTLKLRTAKRAADPLEYQWREADLPDLTWRTGTDLQPRTSTQRLVARWQLRGSVCLCACAYARAPISICVGFAPSRSDARYWAVRVSCCVPT